MRVGWRSLRNTLAKNYKGVDNNLEGELKPSVKKRLNRLQKEALAGKNLSPTFRTPQEMDAYLGSLR